MQKSLSFLENSSVPDFDFPLKIPIIGDSSVGKTSLMRRLCFGEYSGDTRPTTGVDLLILRRKLEGRSVQIQLWDTAGGERFRTLSAGFYRGAHGAVIVFDLSRKETFSSVKSWQSELEAHMGSQECPVLLLANKSDLEADREVSEEDIARFAADNRLLFAEVSAKSNAGNRLSKAFDDFAPRVLRSAIDGNLAREFQENGKAYQEAKLGLKPTPPSLRNIEIAKDPHTNKKCCGVL